MKKKYFVKHDIYLGLFDKDTHTQKIASDAGKLMAERMVARYYTGATVFTADGIYYHDDGSLVIEPSLKIEILVFSDKDPLMDFIKELKETFNQESVALQNSKVESMLV
jgi:PII-like signaling protein